MRIVCSYPSYQSSGAETAGNWQLAWVAYPAGALKIAGFDDGHFIDAKADDLKDETLAQKLRDLKLDVVGCIANTRLFIWLRRFWKLRKTSP